jgi:hypothetical protein
MFLLATAFRHATNSTRKLALVDAKKTMATENESTPPNSDHDTTPDTADTTNTEDAKETRLNEALASIPKNPSMSVNLKATAHKYNISYDTLWRQYRGETGPKKTAHIHLQKLTPDQEQKVVDWAIFLSIQGRPAGKDMLAPKLIQLCPAWAKAGGPSKHWWGSFFKRHPEIKLRKASGIPPNVRKHSTSPRSTSYSSLSMWS